MEYGTDPETSRQYLGMESEPDDLETLHQCLEMECETISAHLVKMEAGKARLYKDCIGWPKTQLLKALTSTTSPR